MGIGLIVLPVVLVVLVASLVLLVSGKGAARWVGLSILLIVLGGASMLLLGAPRVTTLGTPSLQRPVEQGGALLVVQGSVPDGNGISMLTPALDARLDEAGLRGDDTAVFGAEGDQYHWFQSRMVGSSGTAEFLKEFALSDGATPSAVRAAVQGALFEALGTEESSGLEELTIQLSLWPAAADAPELWTMSASASELNWVRSSTSPPSAGPANPPGVEAPEAGEAPEADGEPEAEGEAGANDGPAAG